MKLALALLALAACAPGSALTAASPDGLRSVVVVARGSADVITALEATDPLQIPLPALAAEVYVLLSSKGLDALALEPGEHAAAVAGAPGRGLPDGDLGVLRAERASDDWTELAPAQAPTDVRVGYPALPCDTITVQPYRIDPPDLELRRVVATSPDTALFQLGLGDPRMAELDENGAFIERVSPTGRYLRSFASDGDAVWAIDAFGTLLEMDRHGALISSSTTAGVHDVTSSGRRAYAWGEGQVYALAHGAPPAPIADLRFGTRVEALAVLDAHRMIAKTGAKIMLREAGEWQERPLAGDDNPVEGVAIDERAAYAVTNEDAYELLSGASAWRALGRPTALQKFGVTALGGGKLAVWGAAGYIDLRLRLEPESWCRAPVASVRFVLDLSLDPGGRVMFAMDTPGGSSPASAQRLELPEALLAY